MNKIGKFLVMLSVIQSCKSLHLEFAREYLDMKYLKICLKLTSDNERANGYNNINLRNTNYWFSYYQLSRGNLNSSDLINYFRYNSHQLAVIVDMQCKELNELFDIASKNEFFNSSYHWILLGDNVPDAFSALQNQNINIDSEINLLIPFENDSVGYNIYDVYNPSHSRGGKLNITFKGSWSPTTNIEIVLKQNKLERRSNLNGIQLKLSVALFEMPKNTTVVEYLESRENVHLDAVHRYCYHLYKLLMEKYNFTIQLTSSDTWGVADENKSWSGVIGMLQRKEVDLVISPLRFNQDRIYVHDHVNVVWVAIQHILFRHPKNSGQGNIFLRPFDMTVWIALFISFIFFSIFLFLTFRVRVISNDYAKQNENDENSPVITFFINFGIFVQQGFFDDIFPYSSRILVLFVLFLSMISFQFYSAILVASLLTVSPTTINTVDNLINSHLELGVQNETFTREYFTQNYYHVATEIYERKLKGKLNDNFFTLEEGVRKMKNGGFAFYMDMVTGYKLIQETLSEEEVCDLHPILVHKYTPLTNGIPKGSPFRELLRFGVLKASEGGHHDYLRKIWHHRKPKCAKSGVEIVQVDLQQMSSGVITLCLGILISLLLLVFEILYYRFLSKRIHMVTAKLLRVWGIQNN